MSLAENVNIRKFLYSTLFRRIWTLIWSHHCNSGTVKKTRLTNFRQYYKASSKQTPLQNVRIESFTIEEMPTPVKKSEGSRFMDDVFYPKPLLKKMAEKGLNVSGLKTITGMYHADHSGQGLEK